MVFIDVKRAILPSIVALLGLIGISFTALSADEKSYPPSAETPYFGVRLLLIKDEQAFFTVWRKSEPPQVEVIGKIKVGEPFAGVIVFWGGSVDSRGHCQIHMRVRVIEANGNRTIASGDDQPVCTNRSPPPKGILDLGETDINLTASGEPTKLSVEVTITDHVSGQTITLAAPIEVVK